MKTTMKIAVLLIATVITVKAAGAFTKAYTGLQQRYAAEASGKALGFINSQMY